MLVNIEFVDVFPSSEVHYLIRDESDHAPLQLICNTEGILTKKPSWFLNFWTKYKQFKEVVRQHWVVDFVGSPFIEVQAKLKSVRKALAEWSKQTYGNIFKKVATLEDVINAKEAQFEVLPSPNNKEELKKAEAELRF